MELTRAGAVTFPATINGAAARMVPDMSDPLSSLTRLATRNLQLKARRTGTLVFHVRSGESTSFVRLAQIGIGDVTWQDTDALVVQDLQFIEGSKPVQDIAGVLGISMFGNVDAAGSTPHFQAKGDYFRAMTLTSDGLDVMNARLGLDVLSKLHVYLAMKEQVLYFTINEGTAQAEAAAPSVDSDVIH